MAKEVLFKLFGEKAEKTIKALEQNKNVRWDIRSVEGRTVLECWID